MKKETVNRIIGNIDDDLIESADAKAPKKNDRSVYFKWAATAASFVIVIAVLAAVNYSIKHKPHSGEIEPSETAPYYNTTEGASASNDPSNGSEGPMIPSEEVEKAIESWDNKLIFEKYTSLYIYDTEYSPLGPNYGHSLTVGEKLFENARLTGQCGDEIRETAADVYALEKVLPGGMVNVRFDDKTDCIYFCRDYYPETLGDLISDLYLDVSLMPEFGQTPPVFDEDGKLIEGIRTYVVNKEEVLSLFKQNGNVRNGADRNGAYNMENETVLLTVGLKVASYGYPFCMWLTESGYLRMNIFNKYSFFHIGSEAAKAFADSIISREAQIPETEAYVTETAAPFTGIPE